MKNKVTFNLFDDSFSHDLYSVAGRESQFINWDRNFTNPSNCTFFTHNRMFTKTNDKNNSYGLLFESRAIIPSVYSKVEPFLNNFNKVFTHNSDLLKKYDNCFWIPGGGVWIGGSYGKGEIGIKQKKELCSIVSSNKRMCQLHNYRLEIVNSLNNSNVKIFGINGWTPIYKTLENFMFSIVVENFRDDMYFTEKILNCFATGTIPIYLGAKNIGEKFNIDGIMQFSTINQLLDILPTLSKDLYYNKMYAIEDNFNRCKEYMSIEDYIYINYF